MLEVFLFGKGAVLRLETDAWSNGQMTKASNKLVRSRRATCCSLRRRLCEPSSLRGMALSDRSAFHARLETQQATAVAEVQQYFFWRMPLA